jgi:hypothetical protein
MDKIVPWAELSALIAPYTVAMESSGDLTIDDVLEAVTEDERAEKLAHFCDRAQPATRSLCHGRQPD